ncbi:MAG: type 1 glutamine amidotransferase [Syntrophales bacterium]|nr:type 1 glutamine amidotransferase [Syntrophales bacterium]
MRLQGKRIAILAEDLYQDQELWYPLFRFREEGAQVEVVGSGASKVHTSKHGYPVEVDKFAKDVKAEQFDAVIIPGGYAPDHMRRYPAMVSLVRDAVLQGKIVAAICHAGWMLASADVLKGRKVTGFFAIKDDLVHAGATFVDVEVAVDDNIITSRKPEDLPAFCRTIIVALGGEVHPPVCPVCQQTMYSGKTWD